MKRYLMITHDQEIDRRIIQQAKALVEDGWEGIVVCLSYSGESSMDEDSGISLHRIGLNLVVPPCPVFKRYNKRQGRILNWMYTKPNQRFPSGGHGLTKLTNASYGLVTKLNWRLYRAGLLMYYRNRNLACPLPFDNCFYEAAKEYEADAIWAHDLPALPAASRLAEERGIPLVYDSHELYYEQKAFSGKQKKIMRRVESELMPRCALSFTVNDSIAGKMAERYGIDKPRVLLNVIDPPEGYDPSKRYDLLREHFGLSEDTLVLLFQGGLLENRNLMNLGRAMCHVQRDNAVLVFMGNGPVKRRLMSMAMRYGVTDRVLFKQAVPQSQLLAWTSSADLGLIPYPAVDLNTYYCTPNKLFEYIQSGLPMLANDLPELNRYVGETGFGRNVDMSSPRAIASAIDQILNDPDFVDRARRTVMDRQAEFSWQASKSAYIEVVQGLLEKV